MAPSAQQEPTENLQSTAIEQAVVAMRLMSDIEAKIVTQTPLGKEEINHLYQFDEPIYRRTRDDWPHGLYGDDDPDFTARIDRYWAAQKSARVSTLETIRAEYGDDADWLLEKYQKISPRIEELLRAGANPGLLAEQLSPADRLRHFELLRSAGVTLDAREVYEALAADDSGHALYTEVASKFIAQYADELIGVDGVSYRLTRASLANAEEGGEEAVIEKLLSLGMERWDILRDLRAEVVEARFQWLIDAGFEVHQLLSRASLTFALDNFDNLFQQDPEAMRSLYLQKPTTEEQVRYVIALHRNGQPVEGLLGEINKGPHYSLTPQFEALLAAGISIDAIVETFSGENESLIHMYAPWLMQNGADPDAIKAKFSPEGIVSVFEALRKAGVNVNLQEYVDQLPASVVISRRFVLDKEQGLEIDYAAQLDAYEYELDMRAALAFIDAGVEPKRVFAKLPAGSIANDRLVNLFVEAGIAYERVWKKLDKSMQDATHWRALTSKDSTDAAFESALKALPVDRVEGVLDDLLSRTGSINLIVDKLATKKRVDHRAKELIERGADPNHVVRNVSKGFWGMYNDASWLLDNGVEAPLLYDHLKGKYIGVELLKRLIDGGVPAQSIFDSLDEAYLTNNFEELTALGYDAAPIVKKVMTGEPKSGFVLKNLKLLNDAGYSADQISGHLSAREVVENVQELLLLGLSPAIAITHCMQTRRVSQKEAEEIIARQLGVAY